MKGLVCLLAGFLGILGGYTPLWATPYNVALNAKVTLDGTFFNNIYRWGSSYPDNPATLAAQQDHANTVTDGLFKSDEWQWNKGTTWWDAFNGVNKPLLNQHVLIDLKNIFKIESLVVQADDNDAYLLEYWDLTSLTWKTAWNVPNYNSHGWGLQTRPNDRDNSQRYLLGAPITTNSLRFSGVNGNSDKYYSVSEIQAFGEAAPVPEPTTLLLFGTGLAGLAGVIRKNKK